ncbi:MULTISPECIES: hypothetical protein [unclassified Pedobacter]|uniref:hypothetical protein n=1 Tax=unclassified Pedobacter TaxID=2628915 RepID=UPI00142132BB|nr:MULTISPECIES: hypothetical protein [unclassified Pedobacter]NII84089.1 hypothetical protein [Pedobacter sp. SG908]NMN38995.1 hypothetical protein [Pedobacter sp. SG918]
MKNTFYLLVIAVLCACNSEKKETTQAVIPTPTGIQGLQKSNTVQPATQQAKTNLIFNPPHGEAGHTCALAVGAPLHQTAAVQPQKSVSSQPVTIPAPPVINTSGKKLNPKHGEPGHRCDIAVGAPLDSKPTQIVTAQPAVKQTVAIKTGKGLNPPHGQPNHRCDIAVGAPLNSKPVQAVNTTPIPTPETKTSETKVLETKNEGK